ncbi:Eukaryotic translation initiation factor 3 subunit H [Podochytrium sp. JEL0797]|nr:Eukaryotic translation initiation factor 3 subunit H [Podochytrium sp. JEL0797]
MSSNTRPLGFAAAAAAFAAAEEQEKMNEDKRIKGTFNTPAVPLAAHLNKRSEKNQNNATALGDSEVDVNDPSHADFTVDLDGFDPKRLATVPVTRVVLDAQAVLRIVKHASTATPMHTPQNNQQQTLPPTLVGLPHGILLGLDIEGDLCVSAAQQSVGPTAPITDDGSVAPGPAGDHQLRMIDCLQSLGYDDNVVGLYVCAPMGSFWSQQVLEATARHQRANPQAVLVVYDPLRSAQGSLSLSAFRLLPQTLSLLSSKKFTMSALHATNASPSSLFAPVPLTIRTSPLVSVLLNDIDISLLSTLQTQIEQAAATSGSLSTSAAAVGGVHKDKNGFADLSDLMAGVSPNFESLGMGAGEVYLEKHLEALSEAVDDYGQEQWRWQGWNRSLQKEQQKATTLLTKKRAENSQREATNQPALYSDVDLATAPASLTRVLGNEPSRLETLVLAGQIETWCQQINGFAGPELTKMQLPKAVSRG